MSIIKDYNSGKTELNKLKYTTTMGAGHPGKAPLITRDTPIEPATSKSPEMRSALQRRGDDLARVTKLFGRSEGLTLLSNNTALNGAVALSRTVFGTKKDKIKALTGGATGNALKDTLGTLASTLAQVAVAGTGTHFIKGKAFGTPSYPRNKVATQIAKFGEPGKVKVVYNVDNQLSNHGKEGQDKVNMQDVYASETEKPSDDSVKFLFEVIRPGETSNVFLPFRAYIENFSDNYAVTWTDSQYIGRGEKFKTYSGFDRTVEVTFKSAVATKEELKPLYKKLVYLSSTTAPTYSKNDIMNGTFIKLTIGDYFSKLPGIVTSVSYTWSSNYPFEVALGKTEGYKTEDGTDTQLTQQLPHILDCSISFVPIHYFTPQTGLHHYITNPSEEDSQFFTPGEQPKS